MTMTSRVEAKLTWLQKSALDLSTVVDSGNLNPTFDLATGTTVDKADIVFHDTRTVTTGANDDLDLSSTSALVRAIFGTNVPTTFVRVKAILIENTSLVTGEILYLDSSVAAAFTGWCNGSITSKAEIGPKSFNLFANLRDGWAVTATTADILRIHNGGSSSIIYKITIIGTSA